MPLIVQKFGGTSVADSQKILAAARKAVRAEQQGAQVVVVVSAMGKNTDALIALAGEITDTPPDREMDMLLSTGEQVSVALMAMAIDSLGHKAISFTGAQVGITTDSTHTQARIQSISTERMHKALDSGRIVIVAGFQGIDDDYNITTLGRGGSDTTAVALAAVLRADACEIHTDVDGVYTTDPRLLPEARKVGQISYDEMLELASLGSGVMHNRSIEFAKKYATPIHVRSSFSDVPGTVIVAEPEDPDHPVSGAALFKDEARVTVSGVPDRPGTSLAIFSKVADHNISVDMIVQNEGAEGKASISFTVRKDELKRTLEAAAEAAEEFEGAAVTFDDEVAKVSVVGLGMARQAGVAQRMFRALADAGVNILMITTSEIKISVLVRRSQAQEALRAAHQAFQLEKPPAQRTRSHAAEPRDSDGDPVAIVSDLQGMEDLTVDDVSLDETQGRITLGRVPDSPGWAAQAFESLAKEGVFVDMIVQGAGSSERADLSFTVRRDDL
ncbi:MAG: aspartate kinase, partial [Planctomycetales bacterium]